MNDLTELLDATRKIAAQTRQRVSGTTPSGATRQVSLHDPDARPIAKGRLGKAVEFGGKAQVMDNDDGVITVSSWTTTWNRGTPPMPRNWPRPWKGSPPGPAGNPER